MTFHHIPPCVSGSGSKRAWPSWEPEPATLSVGRWARTSGVMVTESSPSTVGARRTVSVKGLCDFLLCRVMSKQYSLLNIQIWVVQTGSPPRARNKQWGGKWNWLGIWPVHSSVTVWSFPRVVHIMECSVHSVSKDFHCFAKILHGLNVECTRWPLLYYTHHEQAVQDTK